LAALIQPESSLISFPAVFASSSSGETFEIGERIATLLEKGSIVALKGPLGAGKTCLAKGIGRGLGIAETLTSPTYTIISEHEGAIAGVETVPIYHIDAYRLSDDNDFSGIGGEEIVFGNGISIIEWCERIPGFIPKEALKVDIEIAEDGKRIISLYRENGGSERLRTAHEYPCH
jgi:tRNA threonylcarbamoyladenosine biosynthesis protein TsaE